MAQVKPSNKKKMSKNSLIATIVAIALLVAFVVTILASSGIFVRAQKGASSENFEINGSMMDYFTTAAIGSWYQDVYMSYLESLYGSYYQLYLQYGMVENAFDPSKPADEQIFDKEKNQTYADILNEYVTNYVENILRYCEAAKADEKVDFAKIETEAKTEAATTMKNVATYAALYGMDTINYIRSNYGPNINEKDLEKCLVLEHIANDYSKIRYDRIYDETTPERKTEFFEKNINASFNDGYGAFVSAEVLYYNLTQPNSVTFPNKDDYNGADGKAYKDAKSAYDKLTAEQKKDKEEPKVEDYTGGENSKAYKDAYKAAEDLKKANDAQMIADKELMNKLANVKNADDFKKIVLEEKFDANFESAYNALKFEKEENKPTADALAAFKASVKDKIIAAAIAGKTVVEEKLEKETTDSSTEEKKETDWEKHQKTLPDTVLGKLNTVLSNLKRTVSYTTLATSFAQKLFGGVKAEYSIDYEKYELDYKGTNAKVGDVWFEDDVEENIKYLEYMIAMYKEKLNEEDADKESIEKTIETLEKNLKDAKEKDLTKTGEYSYTAYIVTEAAHRDEIKTRHVGHILFKVDSKGTNGAYKTSLEAKKAADLLMDELDKLAAEGKLDKAAFEELAKNTHDSNIFYEDVYKGWAVKEFDEKVFELEKGKYDLVYHESTGTNDYEGYHIVYLVEENDETGWQFFAHNRAAQEDFSEWSEGLESKHSVEVNAKLVLEALSR